MAETLALLSITSLLLCACSSPPAEFLPDYPAIDLLIENGSVLDGSGGEAVVADIAIVDDTIVFVGDVDLDEQALASRVTRRLDAAGSHGSAGLY